MGMTNNQLALIRKLAENNIKEAKQYAVMCCKEDTTAKNKKFCNTYIEQLEKSSQNFINLPQNMSNLLVALDTSTSFQVNRYFLTKEEKDTYDHIKKMKEVSQKLSEIRIPYKNTTLLYGESGTGKTTFAQFLAYNLQMPLFYVKFSHVVDSYLGGTAKNISKIFDFIRDQLCILFLDEIDYVSIDRYSSSTGKGSEGEMARTTITLMQELDKISNDVIIIAATNRMEIIDPALLRRFSLKHEVKPLDKEKQFYCAVQFLNDVGYPYSYELLRENINGIPETIAQSKVINWLTESIATTIYNDKPEIEFVSFDSI